MENLTHSTNSLRKNPHGLLELIDRGANVRFIDPLPSSTGKQPSDGMKTQIIGRDAPDSAGSQQREKRLLQRDYFVAPRQS
ncbi:MULTISPECIES: hypothetical protein [unclassified Pseudomonas]|uniref:hypothetical protein n=1 Tax=unclassified Pseudomonas TaxID=196821 RepID=UPI0011AED9D8|nr:MULTISPECIES: hypothetical protein [unclassified Pseudomonas]